MGDGLPEVAASGMSVHSAVTMTLLSARPYPNHAHSVITSGRSR